MKAFSLLFLGFFFTSTHANSVKIGYIDVEQVIINLPQYQISIDEISNEFEPKKLELLVLFNRIEFLRENIKNINTFENKEALKLEASKILALEESFKYETNFWQDTMNNKKIELLQNIELLINTSINEFAISENYDLILYENAAFVSEQINITDKIIKKIKKLSFNFTQPLSNTKLIK
jgi:outer membrane protein